MQTDGFAALRRVLLVLALTMAGAADAGEVPSACDYLNSTLCCLPSTLLDMIRDWLAR